MFTPKGKRKRGEGDEKENQPPQGVKMARKLLGGNSMLALKFIDGLWLYNLVVISFEGHMASLEFLNNNQHVNQNPMMMMMMSLKIILI